MTAAETQHSVPMPRQSLQTPGRAHDQTSTAALTLSLTHVHQDVHRRVIHYAGAD